MVGTDSTAAHVAKSTRIASRPARDASIIAPFTVICDTREQAVFSFAGIVSDAAQGCRPVIVNTVRDTLKSGDYSLLGFADCVAVERKSACDLFNTLGQGRGRFERELARLAELNFAAVVCEADWSMILTTPPERSQLKPKTVFRSVLAWQQRYPTVHWWLCPGRRFAEVATFRILERWWKCNNSRERWERASANVGDDARTGDR